LNALYVSIDHPAIACFDVKKQIAWYCENLGMRVIASNGQDPPAVVVGYGRTTTDGAMIEMMQIKDPGPRADTFARFQPGIRHVAFRVMDLDAAIARLKELGVVFTMSEPGEAVGGGGRCSSATRKATSFRLFRDSEPEYNEHE
jgi:catechol 2,3-dioxygenase-like lactoylglutathione lyase family enzyme